MCLLRLSCNLDISQYSTDCWGVCRKQRCTVFSRVSAHERLKFTGQKLVVDAYMENKPFVHVVYIHVNHRSIKKLMGSGRLHGDGCLLERLWWW